MALGLAAAAPVATVPGTTPEGLSPVRFRAPLAALGAGATAGFLPHGGALDATEPFALRCRGAVGRVGPAGAVFATGALPSPERPGSGEGATVFSLRVDGARADAAVIPGDALPGVVHLLLGSDPSRWRRDLPRYGTLRVPAVVPGVELTWTVDGHGTPSWSATFGAGVPADRLRWLLDDDVLTETLADGRLEIRRGDGLLRMSAPRAFEPGGDGLRALPCAWSVEADGRAVSVAVHGRSDGAPLFVDPSLEFSTRLGGDFHDHAHGVAVTSTGDPVFTGWTASLDFPLKDPFQASNGGNILQNDVFVTRLDGNTGALVYSTYLGGDKSDFGFDVAVAPDDSLALTGTVVSRNWPVVDPVQPQHGGDLADTFIVRMERDGGSLRWSTYFGGNLDDQGHALALAPTGATVVAGWTASSTMPTVNAYRGEGPAGLSDGFVVRYAPDGKSVEYATFLGGTADDQARGIAIDGDDRTFLCGYTTSTDFPLADPVDGTFSGPSRGWVMALPADGAAPVFSTFLGGGGIDEALFLDLAPDGTFWVAGRTSSSDFPTTAGAFQRAHGGSFDGFLARYAADGSAMLAATLLGGAGLDEIRCVAVDGTGAPCVAGASSGGLPPRRPLVGGGEDALDGFAARLSPEGDDVVFLTLLGGDGADQGQAVEVDDGGTLWIAGETFSVDVPVVRPFPAAQQGAVGVSAAYLAALGSRNCGVSARAGRLRAREDGTGARLRLRGRLDGELRDGDGAAVTLLLRGAADVLRLSFPGVDGDDAGRRRRRLRLDDGEGGRAVLRLDTGNGSFSLRGRGLDLETRPGTLLETRVLAGGERGSDVAPWRVGPRARRGAVDLRLR